MSSFAQNTAAEDSLSSSLFDIEREKTPFFRRLDWSAFWTATILSFLVYFFTLAPTVTLEDSGELAVAGDHLGVPHPPGYPIWTMISWCFARIFSWVTYRGQPTPAWSIALGGSAVFGAIAAGLTAMLITRSGSDMLAALRKDPEGALGGGGAAADGRRDDVICWAGGVAGSLLFAFSPVMWSQATICEVYALNAFFLMAVMLMTYRWMRRPTRGLLWGTAFVFGLGLTNYQVLLLAIVPLIIVIFLRDLKLFRDFLLVAIPMLLTLWVLKLGSLLPMEGFPKHEPIQGKSLMYSPGLFYGGLAIAGIGLLAALVADGLRRARRDDAAGYAAWGATGALGLGLVTMFAARFSTVEVSPARDFEAFAALVDPRIYMDAATALVGALGALVAGGLLRRGRPRSDPAAWLPMALFAAFGLWLLLTAAGVREPPPYHLKHPGELVGDPFNWGVVILGFLAAIAVLFALSCTTPAGLYYALGTTLANLALLLLLKRGALLGLTHPATWWFWTPVCLNFVYLALAWLFLPHGRTVSLTVLAAEAGVAFYAYMPIVSDLRNPPMNWGYPRTWEGFKHAITRGQYEKLAPTDIFSSRFVKQVGAYFTDLRTQFTMLVAPLGFLPFAVWHFRTKKRGRVHALPVAIALFAVSCLFVILAVIPDVEVVFDRLRLDKWVVGGMLLLAAAGGVIIALSQYGDLLERVYRRRDLTETLTLGVSLLGIAGALALFCTKGFYAVFEADDLLARARQNLPQLQAGAMLLSVAVVAALLVGLPILRRRARDRHGLDFAMGDVAQQWLIATVAAFLMMSILLTVLANPKGDLQDAFIQKVKFISSHGLFAIWIGYGAILALAFLGTFLERLFRRREADTLLDTAPRDTPHPAARFLHALAIGAACLLPLIPIHQNYFNERLVFELGGAEQNGHDYGWQFGNFQLRGAEAILEELERDEEPLPNPYYPPAMTTNAVFFGGTDPGRFVPTYMIYSALVRPDVFIITQNALADNTYMSVERDLYGDDMWIPTPEDSARAFQIYVDEVESGKRPRNADLIIDHGRVQVSGALGVMEINGILCEMMFERNKALHDFYVEESYVIPWMYPYFTPHGLILKLNPEPCEFTSRHQRDDLDFWDWYTRRLIYSKNFRRDVVAQKSFSKLRSAIAGCYTFRNKIHEAEQAFTEARMLYCVSPEATFRMVQDVYLRSRRNEDAIDMFAEFLKIDPNNERAAEFYRYLLKIQKNENRIQEIAAQVEPGKPPSSSQLLEMAGCYAELGSDPMAARCIDSAMSDPALSYAQATNALFLATASSSFPVAAKAADAALRLAGDSPDAELVLLAAKAYGASGQHAKMAPPRARLLKTDPSRWEAWFYLGAFYMARNDIDRAGEAFSRAVREGGEAAATDLLQKDPVIREAYMAFVNARSTMKPRPHAPNATGLPGSPGDPLR
jgi:tetratricopeptide (TPR) repeat protein